MAWPAQAFSRTREAAGADRKDRGSGWQSTPSPPQTLLGAHLHARRRVPAPTGGCEDRDYASKYQSSLAASRVMRLKDLRTLTPARRLSRYARTDNPATPATTPASPTSNTSGGVEEINVPASTTNPPNIATRRLNPATPWTGAAGRLCTNALSSCPDHPEIWTRGRSSTSLSPSLRFVQAFPGPGLDSGPHGPEKCGPEPEGRA